MATTLRQQHNFGRKEWRAHCGRHINEINRDASLEGNVLLDAGANAVVRNCNYNEWIHIELGKPGTKKTQVRLAGGKWHGAGMTANGEYMIYPARQIGVFQETEIKDRGSSQ